MQEDDNDEKRGMEIFVIAIALTIWSIFSFTIGYLVKAYWF